MEGKPKLVCIKENQPLGCAPFADGRNCRAKKLKRVGRESLHICASDALVSGKVAHGLRAPWVRVVEGDEDALNAESEVVSDANPE
jgi:hypothetical protein